MHTSFVALPVGQGDAFILVRDGKRVDGGKSARTLIRLLALERTEHIDVVVCTHNDQDHAEGIAGLFENAACSVGEVWLPGRWSERIVDLFASNDEFLGELEDNIKAEQSDSLENASPSASQARERETRRGRCPRSDRQFRQ